MATTIQILGRIRGLTRRKAGQSYAPQRGCDCPECSRFRAIRVLATLLIDRLNKKKPKPRRARGRRE